MIESTGPLQQALDPVIEALGADQYKDEVWAAAEEYASRRGRVFEEEEIWEGWTQAFLEWCAVERPWRGGALPVENYLERHADARDELGSWIRSQRCLAELVEAGAGLVRLRDLVGNAEFTVSAPASLAGVTPGDVFECRLLGYQGAVHFGRTFCYHPSAAREAIGRRVAKMRADGRARADVIDTCAMLRIRCERFQHVPPARIYASDAYPP